MQMHTIINNDDGSSNVLLLGAGNPKLAHSSHANYKAIMDALQAGDNLTEDAWTKLFDQGETVKERFQALSERVSVQNGHILLDGDVVDDSLTEQIVRFLDEGIDNWKPLVAFLENVANNPSDHSKTQLYDWLRVQEGITITSSGKIVGYKGVRRNDDGSLVSGWSGKATVQRPGQDPEVIEGNIPNDPGLVVTMPRSEVVHDPAAACHRGLHVGTQSYARSYAQGAMLEVHVDPRDVVSVPSDAGGEKIRVCRYEVVQVLPTDFRYTSALLDDEEESLDEPEAEFQVGDRVLDEDGDPGIVRSGLDEDGEYYVEYENSDYGGAYLAPANMTAAPDLSVSGLSGDGNTVSGSRPHGRGGHTSQSAKGRGRNPAQDNFGRFSSGRPGSGRDGDTGRFTS